MKPLYFTSRAEIELVEIGLELSQYGSEVADRALKLIENRCDVLRRFPLAGECCPEFGANLRRFPAGNYILFYVAQDDGVYVIRILDGRRDLLQVFRQGR